MLWAGGFHHESDYVLVFFIDKIYFDFGSLPVPHAERHCRVNKLLQFIDSHVMVSPRRIMPESTLGRVTVVDRRFALIDPANPASEIPKSAIQEVASPAPTWAASFRSPPVPAPDLR